MSKNSLRKSIHHKLHAELRDTLIKARRDLGLSQRDLAEQLGITHSIIGKIETGDRRLDVIEFYEYTTALELVPSETLFLLFHEHNKLGGGSPNARN
jgi:transcriptional regulator with XRE-family HTH domain